MGVAAVALVYDMTRRMFGRVAGGVAGLAFALTPITVAIARHNNPDEAPGPLLRGRPVVRRARARDRTDEVAGVVRRLRRARLRGQDGRGPVRGSRDRAAWIWTRGARPGASGSRRCASCAGGVAMVAVGGAWPLLVTLTPAADRPWISGTSDNSVWSLIFGYNGLGRVAGQTGGPSGGGGVGGGGGGFGGNLFGGATGPFRLLESALGDQAGWLLGFAVVAGLALLVLTRLRRRDPRTGWLMAVGGAFLVTAVVFSFASGIFHPYYVSFLAPFAAALVGAGASLMLPRALGGTASSKTARIIAPLRDRRRRDHRARRAGRVERVVGLGHTAGDRRRGRVRGRAGAAAVTARARQCWSPWRWRRCSRRRRRWAAETLGHATSSTFPAGGPASASIGGPGGGGGPGGFGGGAARSGGGAGRFGRRRRRRRVRAGRRLATGGFAPPSLFGGGRLRRHSGARQPGRIRSAAAVASPAAAVSAATAQSLTAAIRYAEAAWWRHDRG